MTKINKSVIIPVIYMLIYSFFTTLVDVFADILVKDYHYNSAQTTFFRFATPLIFLMLPMIRYKLFNKEFFFNKIFIILGVLAFGILMPANYCLKKNSLTVVNIIYYSNPILIAIASSIIARKKFNFSLIATTLIAFFGIFLVFLPTDAQSIKIDISILYMIISNLSITFMAILLSKKTKPEQVHEVGFALNFFPLLITLPFNYDSDWSGLNIDTLWICLALGLCVAIGQYFFIKSLNTSSPNIVSIFQYSAIFYTLLFDYIRLGVKLTAASQIVGIVLVVIASCYVIYKNDEFAS